MRNIFQLVLILDLSGDICVSELDSPIPDYEDAVAIKIAENNNISYIITRNLKDFSDSPIPAFSPEDFLALPEMNIVKAA